MRDRFKLRIYDKEKEVMRYNDFILTSIGFAGELIDLNTSDDENTHFLMRALDTRKFSDVMFSTGIKDKHGKLIYEGDIVYKKGSKDWQKNKLYSQIIYDNMYGHFNLSDENGIHNIPMNRDNIEVVGNVYENPELVKG